MTDYVTPCHDPANDPDDWFIEKDGKQYPDDPPLTVEQAQEVAKGVMRERGFGPNFLDIVEVAIGEASEAATAAALVRRRHAKDKCHVDCYARLQCLTIALEQAPPYGTYGGYYPEELREMRTLRDRRAKRREASEGSEE